MLGACVIALENKANSLLLFLCPVWSVKADGYTATTGLDIGACTFNNSVDCKENILVFFFCESNLSCLVSSITLLIEQLESKRTNR